MKYEEGKSSPQIKNYIIGRHGIRTYVNLKLIIVIIIYMCVGECAMVHASRSGDNIFS